MITRSPRPGVNGTPGKQIDWAAAVLFRYLMEKEVASVGVRRLHYWIVSLPEDQRLIPGKGKGNVRIYQNVKNDYHRLSGLLVDARIRGLIPWDSIQDDKNDTPVYMPDRIEPKPAAWILNNNGFEPISIDLPQPLPDFKTYLSEIFIKPDPVRPRFVNQSHRLVVVIEKATSRDRLKIICKRYGADLLVFSGQLSLTRVNDVVTRARKETKPIALFYISDLDCAGWYMPEAFFKRIQDIYPRDDHQVFRVALTRAQAEKFNLPSAFELDDKGYSEEMKANFCELSGGDTCIELDALSENDLISYLVNHLSRYAGLEDDKQLCVEIEEDTRELCDDVGSNLPDIVGDLQDDYTALQSEFNCTITTLEDLTHPFQKTIHDLNNRRLALQKKINQRLMQAMNAEGLAVREDPTV